MIRSKFTTDTGMIWKDSAIFLWIDPKENVKDDPDDETEDEEEVKLPKGNSPITKKFSTPVKQEI